MPLSPHQPSPPVRTRPATPNPVNWYNPGLARPPRLSRRRLPRPAPVLTLALLPAALLSASGPAGALDIKEQEKAALKVCEKRFCDIVLGHDARAQAARTPADFQCRLAKTWTRRNIKDSVDGKTSAWSFGDARCSADVSVLRGAILEVLSSGRHKIEFLPHTAHCEVENGGQITTVDVTVGPKIEFRDGQAVKAWIKLKDVQGPGTWKTTLWTIAKIEDTFGLFQREVLKSINKLVHETCPANYPANYPAAGAIEAKSKPPAKAVPGSAAAAPVPQPSESKKQ